MAGEDQRGDIEENYNQHIFCEFFSQKNQNRKGKMKRKKKTKQGTSVMKTKGILLSTPISAS